MPNPPVTLKLALEAGGMAKSSSAPRNALHFETFTIPLCVRIVHHKREHMEDFIKVFEG